MKLLVVEDAAGLRGSLVRGLTASGYVVDEVADGRAALARARARDYDVVLLDLTLPELDGLEVLRRLRAAREPVAVLVLTARDAVEDRVEGLRAGADDYLVKPFAFEELLARVEALIRRRYEQPSTVIRIGPSLEIEPSARRVTVAGEPVELTRREYLILEYLAHRAGEVVSRLELDEHIYEDRKQVLSNAIDSAVCMLRRKLARAGCPPVVHTRRGQGYVLAEES